MRLLIIRNPVAGQRRETFFQDVLDGLRARGCLVDILETERPGHAAELATANGAKDYDRLVIAGGDGTINEAVNGLMHLRSSIPFAILPLGTANVLAIEIGLDIKKRETVLDYLMGGHVRSVYTAQVNGRHFLLMAGAGFDAHVVDGVSSSLKKAVGKLAYVWCMLRLYAKGWTRQYDIVVDGNRCKAHSVIATKARHYGGAYKITDDTSLLKPGLVVFLFQTRNRVDILRAALYLGLNKLAQLPTVQCVAAQNVEIHGGNDDPLQVDGDASMTLPAHIGPGGRSLAMVWPAG